MVAAALRCLALAGLALAAPAAPAAPERSTPGAAGDLLQGQPPAPGRYDAVMCVAVGARAADCGAVDAEVLDGGTVDVRIADILYRLERWGEQLGITMMHGTMQVDGFFAPYRWRGRTLTFTDTEKSTRYELTLGARRLG